MSKKFVLKIWQSIMFLMIVTSMIEIDGALATSITIDMSSYGQGVFDQNFFKSDGVVFTKGSFVGYVQGDEALLFDPDGGIAGSFAPPIINLSVQIAPWIQGTWAYRLAALDVLSNVLAINSITVTQDEGDPENSGFGYFTIGLSGLPGAVGFFLESTFVRSSFGDIIPPYNAAAMSSMTFTPVPEPSTIILIGSGLIGLISLRKKP